MIERIRQDVKQAMKDRRAARLSTLRMVLAELLNKEKEKGMAVSEEAAVQILQSMVRKRKDAIDQFRKGGRDDLADKEQEEIETITAYLPEQLSEEDIQQQVRAVIAELGVRGPREMGKVMGVLVKKLAGRTDGKTLSRLVQQELQQLES